MKHLLRVITILVLCFSCVACQSTPRAKLQAEASGGGTRAVYATGPIAAPKKEHRVLKTTLTVVAVIIVTVPVAYVLGQAQSGGQIHIGR